MSHLVIASLTVFCVMNPFFSAPGSVLTSVKSSLFLFLFLGAVATACARSASRISASALTRARRVDSMAKKWFLCIERRCDRAFGA